MNSQNKQLSELFNFKKEEILLILIEIKTKVHSEAHLVNY